MFSTSNTEELSRDRKACYHVVLDLIRAESTNDERYALAFRVEHTTNTNTIHSSKNSYEGV